MTMVASVGVISDEGWPIVASKEFILAMRDTGYRNTATAIAELIDNSLQARASIIKISVYEQATAGTPRIGIAVLDNGQGMDQHSLRRALQFGGSERFNDRSGLGRFGMGLPNSSLSQSRRVEVYSWRRGDPPLFTFLDVEEIVASRYHTVPTPVPAALPALAAEPAAVSGTLVVWPFCDRLGYRRVSTVASKLRVELGRVYRYALWRGVRITINGANVEPVDPLMCRGKICPPGATIFGETLKYEIRTPADPRATSVVRVRFSVLPVEAWAPRSSAEKRRLGITGRAGVSVVRADREIDYGWYLMGQKRKENYDDWWRCEVAFEPALDEYFRVTNSKQGITPHAKLREMLAPDLERIARLLNAQTRTAFRRISGLSTSAPAVPGQSRRVSADSRLPRLGAAKAAARRERLLPPLRRLVRRYELKSAPLLTGPFFLVKIVGESVVITINTNHPFHDRVYAPACERGQAERFRVECIVLAAARAELSARDHAGRPASFVEAWSDALAAFLMAR
jgi:histidine kinase/DNA gyrase B/HSP90-like ATPase